MKYDYLIVGAGLFGAVFAQRMTEAGKKCLVIERRPQIGGNVYTEDVGGIHVHKYGAHIFHTSNEEVWNYVRRFADFNDFINSPIANFRGSFYPLPFNMNTFCALWPEVRTAEDAKAKIASETMGYTPETARNLEEKAISLVGYEIYEKLGAHPMNVDGVDGTLFAVWAPNAERVSVVGNFCNWDGRRYQMRKLDYSGIFELFIPGEFEDEIYKYEIRSKMGEVFMKSDPYAVMSEIRPANASRVTKLEYKWGDDEWMKKRDTKKT